MTVIKKPAYAGFFIVSKRLTAGGITIMRVRVQAKAENRFLSYFHPFAFDPMQSFAKL